MKNFKFFKIIILLFSFSILIPTFYQEKTFAMKKKKLHDVWAAKYIKEEEQKKEAKKKEKERKEWRVKLDRLKKVPEEERKFEQIEQIKELEDKLKTKEEIQREIDEAIKKEEEIKEKKLEELKEEMKERRRKEEIKKEEEQKRKTKETRREAVLKKKERDRQKEIEEETKKKISEIKANIYDKYGIEVSIPYKTPAEKSTEEIEAQRAWGAFEEAKVATEVVEYSKLSLEAYRTKKKIDLESQKIEVAKANNDGAGLEKADKKKSDLEKELNETEKKVKELDISILLKLETAGKRLGDHSNYLRQPTEDEKTVDHWKQVTIIYQKPEVQNPTKEMLKAQRGIDTINKKIGKYLNPDGTAKKGKERFVNPYLSKRRRLEIKRSGINGGWSGSGGDVKKLFDTGKEIERYKKRVAKLKGEESIQKMREGLRTLEQTRDDTLKDFNGKLKISKGITDEMEVAVNGMRKKKLEEELGQLKEGDEQRKEEIEEQIRSIDEKFPEVDVIAKFEEYQKTHTADELQEIDKKLKETEELVGAILKDIEQNKKDLEKNKTLLIVSGVSLGAGVMTGILGDISGYDVEIPEVYVEGADIERFAGDFEGGVSEVGEEDLSSEEEEKLERLRLVRLARMK